MSPKPITSVDGHVGLLEYIFKVIEACLHCFQLHKSYQLKNAHLSFSYSLLQLTACEIWQTVNIAISVNSINEELTKQTPRPSLKK